jgi:hypothetical protein
MSILFTDKLLICFKKLKTDGTLIYADDADKPESLKAATVYSEIIKGGA